MQRDIWITCPRPNPYAQLRLFCFPYAGGDVSAYRTWTHSLPDSIELRPVQLPGRQNRFAEKPYFCLLDLVKVLSQVLLPYTDLPFALFGHSMGALIGFELARALRRENRAKPVALLVSGHCAPQFQSAQPSICHLPQEEFIQKMVEYGNTPEAVLRNADAMDVYLPLLRADFAMCDTYEYYDEEPLDCGISAMGGMQDRYVTREDLLGWKQHTRATYSMDLFPGGHFYMQDQCKPLITAIVGRLYPYMSRIDRSSF